MVGGAGFFYRLARRSESEFFLAGRRLPWWLPAASVFSTHTATDTPIWVTGTVYEHGLRGLWYTFFSAWTSVAAFVSARIYRRSVAFTQAEWQVVRFHGFGAELLRGWMAGWQVFMNMFILGWVGIAMGRVCELAFGWPVWVGLVVPTLITALYTLAAGYWGVVMGDFLQGIVAIFAILLVSAVGIAAAGGPHRRGRGRDQPRPGVAARLARVHRMVHRGVPDRLVDHDARDRRGRRLRDGHQHRLVHRGAAHPVGQDRA